MRCFPIALALLACSSTPSEPTGLFDSAADTRTLDMVLVASGSFTIGCTPAQEEFCDDEERPTRDITLSRAFWMTEHEVTQRDFIQLMGENPSENGDCLNCPVEQVSWDDAARFANALSQLEGLPTCYACREGGCEPEEAWLDCRGYRLPTEAEWEYAARCGTDTIYAGGDDAFTLAWTRRNSLDSTQPVRELTPNACGLYDLSGNVWEWVHDYFWELRQPECHRPHRPRGHLGASGSRRGLELRAQLRSREQSPRRPRGVREQHWVSAGSI